MMLVFIGIIMVCMVLLTVTIVAGMLWSFTMYRRMMKPFERTLFGFDESEDETQDRA